MINELLESIEGQINYFESSYNAFLCDKLNELSILSEIASKLNHCWSQSWIGFQSSLYFKDFMEPPSWNYHFDSEWGSLHGIPEYWVSKKYEEIVFYIESQSNNLSLQRIHDEVKSMIEDIKEIQNSVLTKLSIIQGDESYSVIWEELAKIEKHKWGTTVSDLNSVRVPQNISTRDSFALQQGIKVPPHILYENQVIVEISKIESTKEFIKLAKRLLEKIKIRSKFILEPSNEEHLNKILNMFVRFHSIARQLRNRHDNRNTLKIEDEYDVQDLLHALLKLYFDDIRTEEWTPSYAGGSSRMDFILKNENIVIEVKKTRTSLNEKQVGEQLILDIAKYSRHSDCKTLICFVYDPEGRIGNPQGLENDLNKMSNNNLLIVTKIEPKS